MSIELMIKNIVKEAISEYFNEHPITAAAGFDSGFEAAPLVDWELQNKKARDFIDSLDNAPDADVIEDEEVKPVKTAKKAKKVKEELPLDETESEVDPEVEIVFGTQKEITEAHRHASKEIAVSKYRSRNEKLLLETINTFVDEPFRNKPDSLAYVLEAYLPRLLSDLEAKFERSK